MKMDVGHRYSTNIGHTDTINPKKRDTRTQQHKYGHTYAFTKPTKNK